MSECFGKLSRAVARFIDLYALAIGSTAIRIDYAGKRVWKSRLASIYVTCINVGFVAGMPFVVRFSLKFTGGLSKNNILEMVDAVGVLIAFTVVVLMMVFRRSHERLYEAMAHEFFALDRAYFDGVPRQEHIERHFDFLLLAKAVPTFAHIAINAIAVPSLGYEHSAMLCLMSFYIVQNYSMMHSRMFHFFLALAQAHKRFQLLNAQLRKLSRSLCAMPAGAISQDQLGRSAIDELEQISEIHWRLTCLVQRISKIFRFQILGVLLIYSMHNIITAFFSVLAINETLTLQMGIWPKFFAVVSCMTLLADMYIFFYMCGITIHAQRSTADILKELLALPCVSASYERCSERFSLELLEHKLEIGMYGLFDLDMQSFLLMSAFILQHSIILVQFDIETRQRQIRASYHKNP